MKLASFRILTAGVIGLTIALGGCGDEPAGRPPGGPLAEALAEIGGGGANGSLGVGWADPQLVKESGVGAQVIGEALLPNARTVIEATPRLRRRFGFDPLAADRLMSVGGSYAFGLRLDGVDGRGLAGALVAAGGRTRGSGAVKVLDIGDYAVVPNPLLRAGVRGLGAFDALGRDLSVLAFSDRARAALLGRGDRLIDEPVYRAAADCLGDVVAARMIPDKLLLSTDLGVDLVAVGVRPGGGEVLCVLGGTAKRSVEVALNLESSLNPGARDPGSGEPIGDAVATADVLSEPLDGVEAVRSEVTLAPGEPAGYLFGTISRASVVALINGRSRTFTKP